MITGDVYCRGMIYARSGLPSEGQDPEVLVHNLVEYSKPPVFLPDHAAVMADLARRFSYGGATVV